MRRFCNFPTTAAALLGIVFGTIAPAAYGQSRDVSETLPADTLAYVSWSRIVEPGGGSLLNMALESAPALVRFFDADEDVVARVQHVASILRLAAQGDGALALLDLALDESRAPKPLAALVASAGPQTADISEGIQQMFEMSGETDLLETVEIGGVAFQHVDDPEGFYWGEHRQWLMVATQPAAIERVIQRLNAESPALTENSAWQEATGRVGADAAEPAYFTAFADVPRVLERVRSVAQQAGKPLPPIADRLIHELGLDALRGVYMHCADSEYGALSHVWIGTDSLDRGILSLWGQRSLEHEHLALIPQDAYWGAATRLDLAALVREGLRAVEAINPDAAAAVEGVTAAGAAMFGFSITDDLLPALGDTWVLFDAPDHGGLLFSGTALVLEPADAEALRGIFGRLVQMLTPLAAQGDITLYPRRVQHRGHTIHYVVLGGAPTSLTPAAAFVDRYVVVGMTPQVVKVALEQVDPQLREGSILDAPDVQALQDHFPTQFQTFGYNNAHAATRSLYPFLNMLRLMGASLSQPEPAVEPGALPTLPESLAGTHDGVRFCTASNNGVLYTSYGSTFMPTASFGYVAIIALMISILLPSLARARELAKRAVSASNLRGIGQGCHISANDHDQTFPESLETLVEAGMCTRKQLVSPRDPRAALSPEKRKRLEDLGYLEPTAGESMPVSYVYIAGQSYHNDPRNVLAYEKIIGDEGTNVLYLDGHVNWEHLPEFKRALLETYKRLGREDEMPAELRP